MLKIKFVSMLIVCCLLSTISLAQPGSVNSHEDNDQSIQSFNDFRWKMKPMLPGEGIKEGLHELPPTDIETLVWNPAEVPGDVFTDCWKAGIIDDPYFGRNGIRAQWVNNHEWWYSYQFRVRESLKDKVVRIDFEGVDYSCDVYLNGKHLGRHIGAFSGFSFDVTPYLNSGADGGESANILIIKLDPPPKVNSKVVGTKTPWFGDYWRDLIPFGIWRKINMVTTGVVRIQDMYANTILNKDGSANIDLEILVENTSNTPKQMTVVSSIEGKNCDVKTVTKELKQTFKPGVTKVIQSYKFKNPELWWPWDLGKPNLHLAKVTVKEEKSGINHDFNDVTFGIRKIHMEWNPGFKKDVDVSFPRSTYINNKFHFIRSACWGGPPDIFTGRTSPAEYKKLIKMAKEANMNNIRIFGWHPPEIPEFYEYCNEEGITVWQDVIPLGTGNFPNDKAFTNPIIQEAVRVMIERRNHPSLIMIEGGEEMMLRATDPLFTRAFLEELRDSLHVYCDLPYVPDSPLSCERSQKAGYKPKEAKHALMYFYAMGSWGLMEEWYKKLDYPIIPELAITSVPSVESLKHFIPENEMWPPGVSWGYHWADLHKLRIQNWDTFGDEKTGSLEEFVNATQDAQGTIFQLSVEHFRRNKPRLSGIALCHFITYWPDMKWGIVDNYQEPKRSYEFVKTAYQPLLVNLNFEKRRWENGEEFKGEIWIINDLYEGYKDCKVNLNITDNAGKTIYKEQFKISEIKENSAKKFFDISTKIPGKVSDYFYASLSLTDKNNKEISKNNYMFLIGNQKEAMKIMREKGKEMAIRRREFGGGNYLQHFDEMTRKNGKDRKSDMERPKAFGFPDK